MTKEKLKQAVGLLEKIKDFETLVEEVKAKKYVIISTLSVNERFDKNDSIYTSVLGLMEDRLASLKEEFDAL